MIPANNILEADQIVLAEAIVLIEHRDLRVWLGCEDVPSVNMRLSLVVGNAADGPGEMLGIGKHRRAGQHEKLGHLVVVAILPDRCVWRRAESVGQKGDMLLLDQPPHLLNRLRRAIGVVEADEIDLAAVNPALIVDHLEIGSLGAADHAKGGCGPAVGYCLPDLDFRVGDAGRIFGPPWPDALGGICGGGRGRLQQETARDHAVPPGWLLLRWSSSKTLHEKFTRDFLGTFFNRTL